MNKRMSLKTLAALTLAMFAAVPVAHAADNVLKIGVNGVMSGAAASWGLVNKYCAETTAEMYNAKGGVDIGGKKYKIEIVALNKIDAVTPDELKKQKDRLKRAAKKTPLLMSGATGEGVKDALRALVEVIGEAPVSVKAKGAARAEPWAPTTIPQG